MKRRNATRNALFTSVLSLLLCVSMLVGTTFAWFTDEVVTGMNTIAAGNLDVELLADGVKVEPDTKLFDMAAPNLWEPGVVVYEKLQVANVGTLALKYQMTLNFGNENDLNGHKLSEVLKAAVLEETAVADWTDRNAVLAAAEKANADKNSDGSLANLYLTGTVEAGQNSEAKNVVIYWAPNDNATDNLYNANNGQKVSDYAETGVNALYIEIGINLQATQKMSESDSFGNDYDKPASILPKATVNNTGVKTVPVFMGYGEDEITLDTSFQFLPNETAEEGLASQYANWHADYVIEVDRDVPANSMALAGYYEAWCGSNGWVVLTYDGVVPANTPIQLVKDGLGKTVSYWEICDLGNDGTGFLCGAVDLTGANVGTTLTVSLVMYETYPIHHGEHTDINGDYCNGDTANCRTGVEKVVGTYSYTFGAFEVNSAAELQSAINNGVTEIKLGADIDLGSTTITVPNGVTTTLDLNGYVISGVCNANDSTAFTVDNGATLNIKDSSAAKTGKISYASGSTKQGYAVKMKGVLNLYSGTIELAGDWSGGINYAVDVAPNVWGSAAASDVVFNMYGGKVISAKDAIRVANYSAESYNTMTVGFNMEGGEIIAARDGIFMQQHNANQFDLSVTVTGGTIKADVRPIRVYSPIATGTLSGNAKSMTITALSDALVLDGAVDTSMTWHTEGKIAVGGGMTVDNLNQYATITLN